MKVLVQWSQAQAEDWREYDSAEWTGLSSKPLPVGSEIMDNALGWVNAINVQGVVFVGYDHYACEDLPGGACRITAWKDDLEDAALDLTAGNVPPGLNPLDYGPADLLYARVWEFEPVAKYDGRQYNTRQRQTIYAGRAIRDYYAALGPVENTTVRPWEELGPPPTALTRHGVWMPDDLMRAHEAAQSLRPWMEWAPELVIPHGPEHHSITYLLNAPDTADSDCVPGVDHSNKMDEAGQTSEDLSAVFTGSQNKVPFAFTTLAGDPNSADWPAASAGDPWRCDMNIVAAGADISYGLRDSGLSNGGFLRLSGCIAQETRWEQGQALFTGAGVKSATNTVKDPAAGAASDRFQIRIVGSRAASHGSQTLTLRTDASSFAQGPWSVGATISPSAIASAEAFGTAKETLTLPTVGGLASGEVFGSSRQVFLLTGLTGIPSQEVFGTPLERLTILGQGFGGEVFGTLRTLLTIIGAGAVPSTEAFGAPRQVFLFAPAGISSTEAFGTAKEILALLLTGIPTGEVFGLGALVFIIRPTGIPSGEFGSVAVDGGEPLPLGSMVPLWLSGRGRGRR